MTTSPPLKKRKVDDKEEMSSSASTTGSVPVQEERLIDVSKLYDARAKEIRLLEDIIWKSTGGKRMFQRLPRHMRRRAMSHNPHRLPPSMRARAFIEESKSGGKPTKDSKRKHKSYKRRLNRVRNYEKRQIDKRWLPTHLWHAKRFHMENRWGFRLAITPTNKGARAVYRASKRYTNIYDASHTAPFHIAGKQSQILALFGHVTNSKIKISNSMYKEGSRAGKICIYDKTGGQPTLIAPVEFMWRPVLSKYPLSQPLHVAQSDPMLVDDATRGSSTTTTSTVNETANSLADLSLTDPNRELWVWVHPAAFHQVSQLFSQTTSREHLELTITPMEAKFVRFELTGPQCLKVLKSVLTEFHQSSDMRLEKTLGVKPSALPSGAILSLDVRDPRVIKLLPPNNQTPSRTWTMNQAIAPDFLLSWKGSWAQSPLWDSPRRLCTIQQKDLNAGTVKLPDLLDAYSNILLIQQSGSQGFASGWSFIAEASWALPFWRAFVFAGGRAIGLNQIESTCFEAETPYFPLDYPDTLVYRQEAERLATLEAETWQKKPPAKRVNYAALGISSPFRIPWADLFPSSDTSLWVIRENVSELVWNTTAVPDGALVGVWLWMEDGGTQVKPHARIFHPWKKDEVIGYVTSGKFSYREGYCKALGFCALHLLRDIVQSFQDENSMYVLVKNKTSQWKHTAYISLQQ